MAIHTIILVNNRKIFGEYHKTAASIKILNLISNIDYEIEDDRIIEGVPDTHYKIAFNIGIIVTYDSSKISHKIISELINTLSDKYVDGTLYEKKKKIISGLLAEFVQHYENIESKSNIIENKIDIVTSTMKNNIISISHKNEQTKVVVEQTEKLEESTKQFEKSAKDARCRTYIDMLLCCGMVRYCVKCFM